MFNFFKLNKSQILKSLVVIFLAGFIFWLGLVVGMKVQPRSILSLNKCQSNCFDSNEVAGLVGSIGIELGLEKPFVQKENDSCFSLKIPTSQPKVHYVIIPKKDIQDIGDIQSEDLPVVSECLKIAIEHINEEGMETYQFTSNGPNYQNVRYLHFHLKSLKE